MPTFDQISSDLATKMCRIYSHGWATRRRVAWGDLHRRDMDVLLPSLSGAGGSFFLSGGASGDGRCTAAPDFRECFDLLRLQDACGGSSSSARFCILGTDSPGLRPLDASP